MEIIAQSKNVHISPRKMRQVADVVKKLPVSLALVKLQFLPKSSAKPIAKALNSALANAKNNAKLEEAGLKIKNIIVNEGDWFSRKYDTSHSTKGGSSLIRRRASHLTVVLTD